MIPAVERGVVSGRTPTHRANSLESLISIWPLLFLAVLISCGERVMNAPTDRPTADRVVLLVLDGVRLQDFFGTEKGNAARSIRTPFHRFWKRHASTGVIYGDPGNGSMLLTPEAVVCSLPSYRTIFSGRLQSCFSNDCGRIEDETFPIRLIRELHLRRGEVASIASWEKLALALGSGDGRQLVNAGQQPFPEFDARHRELNRMQAADGPDRWREARYDRYTFGHALHYLAKKRPRFLFIGLNDADEWGHLDERDEYLRILVKYDLWIDRLIGVLDSLPGESLLLVTTDHGRGNNGSWINHGFQIDALPVWLFARGPMVRQTKNLTAGEDRAVFSHLDIRPTVEKAFGLPVVDCLKCGRPLRNVVGNSRIR